MEYNPLIALKWRNYVAGDAEDMDEKVQRRMVWEDSVCWVIVGMRVTVVIHIPVPVHYFIDLSHLLLSFLSHPVGSCPLSMHMSSQPALWLSAALTCNLARLCSPHQQLSAQPCYYLDCTPPAHSSRLHLNEREATHTHTKTASNGSGPPPLDTHRTYTHRHTHAYMVMRHTYKCASRKTPHARRHLSKGHLHFVMYVRRAARLQLMLDPSLWEEHEWKQIVCWHIINATLCVIMRKLLRALCSQGGRSVCGSQQPKKLPACHTFLLDVSLRLVLSRHEY